MAHLLGTERNGADILSRMIHASRIALAVGFIATGIAVVIGVIVGGLMGYFSGVVDIFGMRVVEIFASIPTLFLLLTFVAFFPRNLYIMMAIIGFTSWYGYALFLRAEFLRLRRQDFVQAAIACGLPLRSILFRHMLPNGMTPILVNASFGVASAVLYESTLSFLGLGLVDEPSWGQMLSQAIGPGGSFYWWIALYPGLAIFLTVFAYNLVGEAMRDAIDPHTQRSAQL
jgi:peptide/nickel transport system permease protein